MNGCRFWIGSDTKGHICGAAVEYRGLCVKHFPVVLERTMEQGT